MTETIVFPDTAAAVADYVRLELVTVHVGTKVPATRPATFVLIRRLGGPRRNLVADEALIGVECWAATDAAAHDLAQLTRGAVHSMLGEVVNGAAVYRITEASGPADLPDPLSDTPRYVFTLTVAMRGAASS